MAPNSLHVVLGAAGGLGQAVVRALAAAGRPVRAVSRRGDSPIPAGASEGVERFAANVASVEQAVEACRGAAVVYCCLNAPYTQWPEKFPPLLDSALAGAEAAGAKFVMGDNLYMYGPVDGPIREDCPEVATGRKGAVRVAMSDRLREVHREGRVRVAIGRASDFYGPGVVNSAMGDRVFGAALRGQTANLVGDLDMPHTYTFIDDFARGLVTLGEQDAADGQVWHTPNAPAVSTREFVSRVYRAAGREPKMRAVGRILVTMMSWFDPMMGEIQEMLYTWERPYVVDHSKFERTFGAKFTPLDEGISRTLEWFRSRE